MDLLYLCAAITITQKKKSFSGPYFPTFGRNTERYSVSFRIQSEYGKMPTRKTLKYRYFSRSETYTSVCFVIHNINPITLNLNSD